MLMVLLIMMIIIMIMMMMVVTTIVSIQSRLLVCQERDVLTLQKRMDTHGSCGKAVRQINATQVKDVLGYH